MKELHELWQSNGLDTFEILKEDNPYDYYPCDVEPRGEYTVEDWEASHPSCLDDMNDGPEFPEFTINENPGVDVLRDEWGTSTLTTLNIPEHQRVLNTNARNQIDLAFEHGLKRQVGGTHYQELVIQPMEYSFVNELNPLAHSIVKYATRAGRKENEDVRKEINKIIHCAEIWLDLLDKYGEK